MSHKVMIGIILVAGFVGVSIYSVMSITETNWSPYNQQEMSNENIILTDKTTIEGIISQDNLETERGRILIDNGVSIFDNTSNEITNGITNGTDHHIIINDGVFGTATQG